MRKMGSTTIVTLRNKGSMKYATQNQFYKKDSFVLVTLAKLYIIFFHSLRKNTKDVNAKYWTI